MSNSARNAYSVLDDSFMSGESFSGVARFLTFPVKISVDPTKRKQTLPRNRLPRHNAA
jgi:hypothetical protein